MHKILVHAQRSCACTKVLCMHNSLVGWDPKSALGRSQAWTAPFLGPRLGPWPLGSLAHMVLAHNIFKAETQLKQWDMGAE